MKFSLQKLIQLEATGTRPRGFVEDFISRGVLTNGEVELSEEAVKELFKKYRHGRLGDWVEWLVYPFAAFSDIYFKTKFLNCQACQRRKAWLNRLSWCLEKFFDQIRFVILSFKRH